MATDAQSLLAAANCYQCFAANEYMLDLMIVARLAQIAQELNPAVDVTPQTILAQAKCFQCYASNEYMLDLMRLQLWATVASEVIPGIEIATEDDESITTDEGDVIILE